LAGILSLSAQTSLPNPIPVAPVKSKRLEFQDRIKEAAFRVSQIRVDYGDSSEIEGVDYVWDCSNTVRYVYKKALGVTLPRTASDQYVLLEQKGLIFSRTEDLKKQLQTGDLLFWENTYHPVRRPPITHVMIFLGFNRKGQMLMMGSQSGPGLKRHNPNGGPDIYFFDSSQPKGGYGWFFAKHVGRFVGYGRPLDAILPKTSEGVSATKG
jgi:hypothetical protein